MPIGSRLASLWRNLLQKDRVEKDLTDEVGVYLEMLVDEKVGKGHSPEAARREALIEMGGVEQVKERVREIRMGHFLETVWQDLRYSARMMRKKPGFTLVAVLTLALGIGASAAIFSVVNLVILNPFPYRDAAGIYLVRQSLPKVGVADQFRASGPEFEELAQSGAFEQAAALEPVSRNLTGGELPERVFAAKVSAGFFPLLGVEPALGRAIRPEDEGPAGERVLVISHFLWQRRFGGDASAVGMKVALDDEPYTVVGVMPPSFRHDGAEAWFPFPMDLGQQSRAGRAFIVLARLKPGADVGQAAAELGVLARRQEQDYGAANADYEGRNYHLQTLAEFYLGPLQRALYILFGAVGLVLLIACTNIANLLLARSSSRTHEIAVRQALGAGRGRLARQLMTESAALALAGGAAGLLLAHWGTGALVTLAPVGTFPAGLEIRIDGRVLLFSLAATLLTALIVGLIPALRVSRPEVREAIQAGAQRTSAGGSHRRAQGALVVAEVGLSLILLVMAGLMVRSFARLTNIDPGFRTENLMSMRVNRSPSRSEGGRQMGPFFQQVIDRVKTTPGIEDAAVASHAPFVYTENWAVTVDTEAVPVEQRTASVDTRTVSADYFRVMGIPLVAGEHFSEAAEPAPVILVNEAMKRRYWPDEQAVGKRLKLGPAAADGTWFQVKGVVADSAQGALDDQVRPEAYFALSQMANRYRRMNLIVRTQGEPKALLGAIQQKIWEIDKDQPVYQVQTLEELVSDSVGTRRFAMQLLLIFAGLAVVLAFVGIYGVMSYGVSQRTHELGIRLALGAGRRDLLRLILTQGMKTVAKGLAIGLIGSFAATRLMENLLYGVSPTDPLTFLAISILLSAVALLACYVPARRAMKVDPIVALRYQ